MAALLRLFWNICLLRAGPEDVPYSQSLFAFISAIYLGLLSLQVMMFADKHTGVMLIATLAGYLLLAAYIYTLLSFNKVAERFLQTTTAVLTSYIIIHTFSFIISAVLVHAALGLFPTDSVMHNIIAFFVMIFILVFNIWIITIMVHIFRKALSSKLLPAVLAVLGLLFANMVVLVNIIAAGTGSN